MKNLSKFYLTVIAVLAWSFQSKAQQCQYVVTNNLLCDVEVVVKWTICPSTFCGSQTLNIGNGGGFATFNCPMPGCTGSLCDVEVEVTKIGTPPTTTITGLSDLFSTAGGVTISIVPACSNSGNATVQANSGSATINQ